MRRSRISRDSRNTQDSVAVRVRSVWARSCTLGAWGRARETGHGGWWGAAGQSAAPVTGPRGGPLRTNVAGGAGTGGLATEQGRLAAQTQTRERCLQATEGGWGGRPAGIRRLVLGSTFRPLRDGAPLSVSRVQGFWVKWGSFSATLYGSK